MQVNTINDDRLLIVIAANAVIKHYLKLLHNTVDERTKLIRSKYQIQKNSFNKLIILVCRNLLGNH